MNGVLRHFRIMLKPADLSRPFTRALCTSSSPFGFPAQFARGLTASGFDQFFKGVTPKDLPEAMRKNRAGLIAMLNALADQAPRTPTEGMVCDPRSDITGHKALLAGKLELSPDASRFASDLRYPLVGPFAAFPNGLRLIPQDLGQAYIDADDKKGFLKANDERLVAFNSDAIDLSKPALSLERHYAVLGNGSVIRIVHHQAIPNRDGTTLVVWHAETTSLHTFDGAFVWAWRFDPVKSTVDYLGVQAGKHPYYDADTANAWAGAALFFHNNNAAPDFLVAYARGGSVTPGDRLVIKDVRLRILNSVLGLVDRLSPLVRYFRESGQPNTKAECVVLDGDAIEQIGASGPEAMESRHLPPGDTAGIFVDGAPVDFHENAFGLPAGPAGSQRLADAVDDMTRYTKSQVTWDRIRERVTAYADRHFDKEWAQFSGSELVRKLLGDPASRLRIEGIIAEELLGPVQDQLQAVIDSVADSSEAATQLQAQATEQFRTDLTAPLLATDGALRSAIQIRVLDNQVQSIDRANVESRAETIRSVLATERAEIERLESLQSTDAPIRRVVEEELAGHRAAEQTASAEAARIQEQRNDLDLYTDIRRRHEDNERHRAGELFPNKAKG